LRLVLALLLALCGDVETNPGPDNLILMTQNCRGLQDYNKLRLVLKNKNAIMSKSKSILALQETHLMNDAVIQWSGNYVISMSPSPYSAGCITYFNDYVKVVEVKQIDNQGHGHVAVIEGLLRHITIVANVYAPVRGLGQEQDTFYRSLLEVIEELELKYIFNEPNLIIMGDYNLPLELSREYHNSEADRNRAKMISENLIGKGLLDCWKINDDRFTYKTAKSRLDRILYRLDSVYDEKLETDWTFVNSDHCLLMVTLSSVRACSSQSRVVSLPTYILENVEATQQIKDKMTEMTSFSNDDWEPRVRLEYLKMCLRTIVGEVTKEINRKAKAELEEIQRSITGE
jgi:exonuclease III